MGSEKGFVFGLMGVTGERAAGEVTEREERLREREEEVRGAEEEAVALSCGEE